MVGLTDGTRLEARWVRVKCQVWKWGEGPLTVEHVHQALKPMFNPLQEEFYVIPVVGERFHVERIHLGGVGSCIVDPRVVFRVLLTQYPNCGAFLVAHNHPSGAVNPSRDDFAVSKRIKMAADVLGYTCHDSLIFSDEKVWSERTEGGGAF